MNKSSNDGALERLIIRLEPEGKKIEDLIDFDTLFLTLRDLFKKKQRRTCLLIKPKEIRNFKLILYR